MDKFSELLPVIIGIIIFVTKIISDSKKKQEQNQQQAKKQTASIPRSPNQYGQKLETNTQYGGTSWEQSRTNENDYRSLDPSLVPKALPDIDYDKITNAAVQTSQADDKTAPLAAITRSENPKLISIRKKLKKADTVKELYLLSEIFNKPKAHRKWQRSIY